MEKRSMASSEKMSVALSSELVAVMRQVVENGEYASASEVMQEALQDWKLRRANREQAADELRHLWDAGIASGEAQDGEAVFSRLADRLEKATAA
jgi:antitoxin ParD1/3/4